jgi:hypothetical protein
VNEAEGIHDNTKIPGKFSGMKGTLWTTAVVALPWAPNASTIAQGGSEDQTRVTGVTSW